MNYLINNILHSKKELLNQYQKNKNYDEKDNYTINSFILSF
jgi:hypothetical protein